MKTIAAICALALGVAVCGCRTHKEETKIYKDTPDTVVIKKDQPDVTVIED
jgi:hypothetical protein